MKKYAFCLLFILTSTVFAAGDKFSRYANEFFDSLSTQINLGYTHFDYTDRTNNILLANGQNTFNASGNGLHGSILIIDEMRLRDSVYIGGRVGTQFWSDLSGFYATPSVFPRFISSYKYQKMYGFFADATLDFELVTDKFDIYGFAGVGYDRYKLTGVNGTASGLNVIFIDSKQWLASPRAGAGFSYTFNKFYLVGIEYTHMFRNTMNLRATGGVLARDNLTHQIKASEDTIDLTLSVYMNS